MAMPWREIRLKCDVDPPLGTPELSPVPAMSTRSARLQRTEEFQSFWVAIAGVDQSMRTSMN